MLVSEKEKLKIRPGHLIYGHRAIIYEMPESLHKIVLPLESQEVVELLIEGEKSITDLAGIIKIRHNGRLNQLFLTVRKLLIEGVVCYANEEPPDLQNGRVKLASRFVLHWVFFFKKSWPRLISPSTGAIISLFLIIGATFGITKIIELGLSEKLFYLNHRYDIGLIYALIFYSFLKSSKTLVQMFLAVMNLGTVYDFFLKITPFSWTLELDDGFIYSASKRRMAVLYSVGTASSILTLGYLSHLTIGDKQLSHDILTLAVLMTVWDLNPFGNGELNKIWKLFLSEEDHLMIKSSLETRAFRSIGKAFSSRENLFYFCFTVITLIWTMSTIGILLVLLDRNIPFIAQDLTHHDTALRTAAGIMLMLLSIPLVYVASDFISAMMKNMGSLNYSLAFKLRNKYGSKTLRLFNRKKLKELISQTPLFVGIQDTTLDYVIDNSLVVAYKAGTPVIRQDTKGSEIYLILTGSVQVQRREESGLVRNLAIMPAGSVFGEMSVYGVYDRTADVLAVEKTQALLIRAEALLELSHTKDHQTQIQFVMDRIMITQYFMSQPLFSSLPTEMIQIFYSEGQVQEYESNQEVVTQGSLGDDFYLILRGSAFVEVNGHNVNTLNQGDFFGEIAILRNQNRTATIRTALKTTLLRVPTTVFWQLAINYPEIASHFENVASSRLSENSQMSQAA